jgi:hypothetical protein
VSHVRSTIYSLQSFVNNPSTIDEFSISNPRCNSSAFLAPLLHAKPLTCQEREKLNAACQSIYNQLEPGLRPSAIRPASSLGRPATHWPRRHRLDLKLYHQRLFPDRRSMLGALPCQRGSTDARHHVFAIWTYEPADATSPGSRPKDARVTIVPRYFYNRSHTTVG